MPARPPSGSRRPTLYVGVGLLCGTGYALLNSRTDVWAQTHLGQLFATFHLFVDRGIPILAGGLVGLALHWLHLRGQLAQAEALRAEELRSRLRHVERDQAAWVVAAAALHELKNPLHTLGLVIDELDHAVSEGDDAAAREEMQRVHTALARALLPLDGLRRLTRASREHTSGRAVDETAAHVVETLSPLAADAGVALRFERDRPSDVIVDAELLRIILDNLVVNALEGGARGARPAHVLVDVAHDADHVRVSVCDDGEGMSLDGDIDPFAPLQTGKTAGLGLGLPIARALARSLGGELAPVARPGFATTLELCLPTSVPR